MKSNRASLEEIRGFFAKRMAAVSKSRDPRLERIFELVPREAFLGPGPWQVWVRDRNYLETPSADPVYLYENSLVALDGAKGINNGEPFLHAAWIGAVSPQRGEMITHIGAGTGYYTAILSLLALPGGRVTAFELDAQLAERARHNLRPFESVEVVNADATRASLPASDIVYVNAGVSAPPVGWLKALKPGGRLIFPWRPSEEIGLTLLVRAEAKGFSVEPLSPSWFIPCIGASREIVASRVPKTPAEARSICSLWSTETTPPDETAIAVYPEVWFSSQPLER